MAGSRPGAPAAGARARSPSVTPAPSCSGASSGMEGGSSGSRTPCTPASASRRPSSGKGRVRTTGKASGGRSRSSATRAPGSPASSTSPGTGLPCCARFWASSSALSAFSRSFREGSSDPLPGAPSSPWIDASGPSPCPWTSSPPASSCRARRAFPSRAFRRSPRDGGVPLRNAGGASGRRPGRCVRPDCAGDSLPPACPGKSSSGNPGPPAVASATSMPQGDGAASRAASGAWDAAFLRPRIHRPIRVAQ